MNEQPKQETLEEASENNYPEGDIWTEEQAVIRRLAFMKGAKWQQQQDKNLYSEEETSKIAKKAVKEFLETNNFNIDYDYQREVFKEFVGNFNEWFEQFKKK